MKRNRFAPPHPVAKTAWLLASCVTTMVIGWCEPTSAGNLPVPCIANTCGAAGPSSWVSAGAATATQVGSALTVNQSSANAILNWQSFNIALGSTVNFKQPSATALALNKIFQGSPSQIAGALKANGRIYLINQNGIMFGSGAQVNVAGLVATSLDITQKAIDNGIAATVVGDPTSPSFVPFHDASGTALPSGAVSVARGANLNAAGGQIFLFAPEITNQGTIATPDGQTILAAGSTVYLATSPDPSVRGLLVAVDAGGSVTNGTAGNTGVTDPSKLVGQIAAQRGNVTLMGLAVNQEGLVSANTSVRANGSILLVAADRAKGGQLTLASNSVTEAGLDTTDTSLAVDQTKQLKSAVRLQGYDVTLADDASVTATSGSVTVTGAAAPVQGSTDLPAPPSGSLSDGARVYFAKGAKVDVSGATASLPMSNNVLQVQLRGSELADEPLQRNGALRGQTVNVDVRQYGTLADGTAWQGTPLANLKADIATIQRGVLERNEAGGSVALQSSGDIIVSPTAAINIGGGASIFQSGYLNTSSVIGANGLLYNIGNASPDLIYTGVASTSMLSITDQRWGVTRQYSANYAGVQGQFQPGYVQGADAGSLALNAPHVIFDGALQAKVQAGPFQRKPSTPLAEGSLEHPYDQLALPGALTVGPGATIQSPFVTPELILSSIEFAPGPVLPTLKNADGTSFNPLTDSWPASLREMRLNPSLIGPNAAGRIQVQANGSIAVPKGVELELPPGGSFDALASNIDIGGTIDGASAPIILQTVPTIAPSAGPSGITLEPSAVLNVAGAWINDNPSVSPSPPTAPLLLNGGAVTLTARDGNIALKPGALIDVSGGAQLAANGSFVAGNAGAITVGTSAPDLVAPTQLSLGATLRAFAVSNGGSLSFSAAAFCLAATASCDAALKSGTVTLRPDFFVTGGFASYALNANFGGLELSSGTSLRPVQQNFLLSSALAGERSAPSLFSLTDIGTLPAVQRSAVNLAFSTQYVPPIDTIVAPDTFAAAPSLVLDAHSSIMLDPLASLSLRSNTRILDDAVISAPGGKVAMTVTSGLAEPLFIAGHQLWLGPHANVDVSGTPLVVTDDLGHTIGSIIPGGSVTLTAQRGAVETLPGSMINVSGASSILDLQQVDSSGAMRFQSTPVASAGGSVTVQAAEAAVLSGSMLASSGNPSRVAGGSLSLVLDGNARYGDGSLFANQPPYPYDPRVIALATTQAPIVIAAGTDLPAFLEGQAPLSAAALRSSGFDSLNLQATTLDGVITGSPVVAGVIQFNGNLALNLGRSLTLDAASFQSNGGKAVLSAPYISLGQSRPNTQNVMGAPTAGTGSLQVDASLMDLTGHFSFDDFVTVALNSSGDIRANGVQTLGVPGAPLDPQYRGAMTVSGALNLTAQQVYPSTLTAFTFTAGAGGAGNLSIKSAPGTAGTPLSAGGTLTFDAPQITQAGVIRAPLGSVVMNAASIALAAGSITSTSADGQTIPFGETQGGFDWVYPFAGAQGLVYGTNGIPLPAQAIQLTGASVDIAKGATLDAKGGGELLATEFVPGPTGTSDVLASTGVISGTGAFAILPTAGVAFAPNDPFYSTGSPLQPNQSVYLSGGGGIAAGTYAVLPARYALLPGAYYVTPVSGFQDITPGQQIGQADGSVIVSGQKVFSATTLGDGRTSGFDIRPGSAVQDFAQYTATNADSFFVTQAKSANVAVQRLPRDAGSIALSATTALVLDGALSAAPATGGRGAALDITSAAIRVVNGDSPPSAEPNTLDVNAKSLSDLGAESILLGGTRSQTSQGLQISTQAATVEVASGAELSAPELLLAGTTSIAIDGGATVGAKGKLAGVDSAVLLSQDGALLRVASSGDPVITRTDSAGARGLVSLLPGSVINASGGAVTVDAASTAAFAGSLNVKAGSLSIYGNQISLGDVPLGTLGIVLPTAILNGLSAANLSLNSRSSLDFYGGSTLSGTNVALSAGAVRGFEQGNVEVTASGSLILSGPASASTAAGTGMGSGTIGLHGGTVELASGAIDLSGFSAVAISSDGLLKISGAGSLTAESDLNMQAALLTAGSGAERQFGVSGAFSYATPGSASSIKPPAEMPLGANIGFTARSIAFDGSAQLHSGDLTLTATGPTGDVTLGSAAQIDLSAVKTVFDSVAVPSRAGTLGLQSQNGSVTAAAGSRIDVSSVDSAVADAGAFKVQAAHGVIDLKGQLHGSGADVSADAQSFGSFAALDTALVAGGFTGEWTMRLRGPGDLIVGNGAAQEITARSVSLTADQGAVDVEGTIRSSAPQGGSIGLFARDAVIVNGTLDARPQGSGAMNGQIELATAQGNVTVGRAAIIEAYDSNVAVQSQTDGGLWIRAPRTQLESGGLTLAGDLKGLRSVTIEGFQTYTNLSGTLGAADTAADVANPMYAGAANFMANGAPAVLAALGAINGPAPSIIPGIEIDSNQSLALTSPWALDAWHFNGAAGALTLRSAGDLTFNANASLSDGFIGTTGPDAYVLTSTNPSWSYRLAAGADLNSSNPLAVMPLASVGNGVTGSVIVAEGTPAAMTMIRTGSGSIDIAAASDVKLTNSDSVIYTAGIAVDGITFSGRGQLQGGLYPTHGGDVRIDAGRDVVGAQTPDLVTNWLWRVGSDASVRSPSTAWTVNFATFEQGIAALGGGNVSVSAGRDVLDLSVSIPTVGRQIGSAVAAGSVVEILNQGDILIQAGNDVAGGSLYAGRGTAVVQAGNLITESPTVAGLYPMVLLGDATATLSARAGATLAGIANPTLLPQGVDQNPEAGNNRSYFSTYGANSAVTLKTTAGTSELVNDTSFSSAVITHYSSLSFDASAGNAYDQKAVSALRIYPGTLAVESLRGGLAIDNTLTLYPEANGSVNLLAHDSVHLGSPTAQSGFELIESNADPALLPTPANPQGSYQILSDQLASIVSAFDLVQNAAIPVHLTGSTPDSVISHIVGLTGNVSMDSVQASQLYFSAPARIIAGQDAQNLTVDFTNLRSTDVSAIVGGRDIAYPLPRNNQGVIDERKAFVTIDGPGTLEMSAGRNVNLGTADGVTSRGNLVNPTLPSGGADLTLEAGIGLGGNPSYAAFIKDYLSDPKLYGSELVAYMQPFMGGSPTQAQSLSAFEALPTFEQAPLIQTVFFDELRASGRVAAADGPHHNDFSRGYAAIQSLFPGGNPDPSKNETNPYSGELSLYFSRVYTLDGGNIDLLAPGGLINVGLASPPAAFGLTKAAAQLGVVAQSSGSVNAYSYGNFEVNQSRVFAADGGNILIWSTRGDIDAGRGAKTAISAPPPTITYVNGVPTVTFPAALTGSGIQTLATSAGVGPGDVDLFAPHGVVNANDAGIVAGNLTIAATAVLGASNIKVSGVSVGVPVDTGGLGASLAGASAIGSSASQSATAGVEENSKRASAAPIAETAIGWLDVFVEGFGADVCRPADVECIKRQSH